LTSFAPEVKPLILEQFLLLSAIHLVGLGTDLAVCGYSIKLVIPLQMSRSKKVFAIFVFSAGVL
jgi:hypothetical protein